MEIRLTDNFYLSEFTKSETADRLGINNTPPEYAINNLRRVAELLQVLRNKIGKPIIINSGYRSPELNARIGGAQNSDHMRGEAADIICPAFGTPQELARFILASKVPFGQLIWEGTWVHLSIREPDKAFNKVLTAKFVNGRATYTQGI
jgi:hypothetical protein